ARSFCYSLGRQRLQRILCHRQSHILHREKFSVLLYHRVLGIGQNRDHLFLSQRIESCCHRQTADEFGNHSERQQIFRLHPSHRFSRQRRLYLQSRTAKPHHFL